MEADRLLARQHDLHGALRQPGEQGGLRLHRHVFLAAERTAVGHEFRKDTILGEPEKGGDLAAVVEDALTLRVEADAVAVGFGEGGLGLEEQVLDALRLPRARHDVRARRERGVGVAAADHRLREQVVVLRVDARRIGVERAFGVGDGGEPFVLDADQ